MQFEFQVTEDDLLGFNNYHYKHSPAIKRHIFLTRSILALSFAIASILINLIITDGMVLLAVAIGLCIGLFMFVITPPLMYRSMQRNAKKVFREGKNTALNTINRYEFTPEGITHHSPISSGNISWQAIEKIEADSKAIYLYAEAVSALVLPRRLFSNDQEFQETLGQLQRYKTAAA